MHENIVNIDHIDWQFSEHKDFSYYRKTLGRLTKASKLGVSLYKLLPNKKAFPCHYAKEEAIFVLEGKGSLKMGQEEVAIVEGDFISFPCGKQFAHQVINTSSQALVYFCISTMSYPDVVVYPDSDKVGMTAGVSMENYQAELKLYFHKEDNVDYFSGEN